MSILDHDRAYSFTDVRDIASSGQFYEDYDRATALVGAIGRAHDAMTRFCDRVEAGEVRSRRTYAEFCEILGRVAK